MTVLLNVLKKWTGWPLNVSGALRRTNSSTSARSRAVRATAPAPPAARSGPGTSSR